MTRDPAAAPFHAHIYYDADERVAAEALRDDLLTRTEPLFVGRMTEGPVGPHPIPQFEVHFTERDRSAIEDLLKASGLRALVHPLTDDDLADHISLAHWIGDPVALDESTLDPPGLNQGVARFGKSDL